MILVTGGTGLVGSHLLYRLCKDEMPVKALYRSEDKKAYVKKIFSYYTDHVDTIFDRITWVKGDITDIPKLEIAFQGVTHIYHCAALVSFDPSAYRLLRKTNIQGTANMVNLALANGITKMVYVSSIAAIGTPKNNSEADEETPWDQDGDHSVYAITKYGAELEVWRGIYEGLDAVIVNPGVIIGSGFWYSGSSSLFRNTYKGNSRYAEGVSGFVAVDDVVTIMVQLMKSTIKSERYILVAENRSFHSFFIEIAKALQVEAPQKKVTATLLALAWRLDWLRAKLRRKRRRLTKHLARSLVTKSYYDSSKIENTINVEFTPLNKSIAAVAATFLSDHS